MSGERIESAWARIRSAWTVERAEGEPRSPRSIWLDSPVYFLALGAGSGLAPRAPGTAGTAIAVPLAMLLPASPWAAAGLLLILFLIGIVLCERTAAALGVHDHPGIVWDEVVGYLATVAFLPADWTVWLLGFVVFRIFDILKPWPIRAIDRQVHGGLGIMLDDLLAAIPAALLVWWLQALI